MKEKGEKMLKELYDFTIKNGKDSAQINRDNDTQWREYLSTSNYLEEKGLIHIPAKAMGFIVIKLSAYGIDYVEGNLL